ncbi:MAG: alkaline phosphatase [Candidatus Electrothrix scaldis]|nr:MAG: alkaline phosphatase [Candidatus Electrothrix sp. GW3-3]
MNIKKCSLVFILLGCLSFTGCCHAPTGLQPEAPEQEKTFPQTPRNSKPATKKVKNVILVIGDGMGPQQLGLLLTYARQAPHSVIPKRTTAFDRMMNNGAELGLSMTHAANVLVTDSAASGSQLATGVASGPEMLGADADGNPTSTILEQAEKMGKSTGIISDTWLTHATPAAFAAHQPHRSLENAIAVDLLNSGADVMLSGGLSRWVPKAANDADSAVHQELVQMTEGAFAIKSKRKDERNLLKEARKKGYTLSFTKDQLAEAKGKKVLGLFSSSAMDNAIKANKAKDDPERAIPSLREMTAKGLELLARNKKGFFLMVEAGQIDWAGHANDTGLLLQEMIKLNNTLEYILDWTAKRDDTLLLVTADHETGGFSFSYSGNDLPQPVNLSGSLFKNRSFQPGYNFGNPQVLDKLYKQQLSYKDIFLQFAALPASEQKPAKLASLVNKNTEFKITEAQAARVLESEENAYYVEGHKKLGFKKVPKIDVNDAFFVTNSNGARLNLLAMEVATQQQAVWSTGTHTATPVLVFAQGAGKSAFRKIMHHTELSRYAINALMNN